MERSGGEQRAAGPGRVVLVAILAAATLLYAAAQRDFGPAGYGLAAKGVAICALGLAPALLTAWRRARGSGEREPFPFLPLVGAIHALFFGAPLVLSDRVVFMSLEPPVEALQRAAELVLLGLALLYAGCWIGRRLPGREVRFTCDPRRAWAVAWALVPLGLAARFALRGDALPPGLAQPLTLLSHGAHAGIGLLAVLGRTGGAPRWSSWVAFGALLPLHCLIEVSSGSIGYAVRDGAFALMLVWGTGGRVPLALLAVGAIATVGLRGAASEYRVLTRHSPHLLEDSALERGLQFFRVARAELESRGVGHVTEQAFGRFSQVALFAEVVDKTPLAVPHWDGATYATLPATFVPRALWPDKPTKDLGQRFGHRYGLLAETDTTTSVNLPQLVEHFVAFGALGVAAGMAALGALYGAFARRLLHARVGDGGLVVAALLASRLLHVESDTSLVVGLTMQLALLAVPLAWATRVREPLATGRAAARPAEALA